MRSFSKRKAHDSKASPLETVAVYEIPPPGQPRQQQQQQIALPQVPAPPPTTAAEVHDTLSVGSGSSSPLPPDSYRQSMVQVPLHNYSNEMTSGRRPAQRRLYFPGPAYDLATGSGSVSVAGTEMSSVGAPKTVPVPASSAVDQFGPNARGVPGRSYVVPVPAPPPVDQFGPTAPGAAGRSVPVPVPVPPPVDCFGPTAPGTPVRSAVPVPPPVDYFGPTPGTPGKAPSSPSGHSVNSVALPRQAIMRILAPHDPAPVKDFRATMV